MTLNIYFRLNYLLSTCISGLKQVWNQHGISVFVEKKDEEEDVNMFGCQVHLMLCVSIYDADCLIFLFLLCYKISITQSMS